MARRPDNDERRHVKRAYKQAERAAAREHMVLDEASLTALVAHVDRAVAVDGCDHSLRASRGWALAHQIDPDVLAASLAHFGGYCDCEVAANVNPEEIFG
jgi:hypothetical protein